jgi:hypothetical protein
MHQQYLFMLTSPPVLVIEDGTEVKGTYQWFIDQGFKVTVDPKAGTYEVEIDK